MADRGSKAATGAAAGQAGEGRVAVVTCIRLRRFCWPRFYLRSVRVLGQARRAPGFQSACLQPAGAGVYWTISLWCGPAAARDFARSGAHVASTRGLHNMAYRFTSATVPYRDARLPSWSEAAAWLAREGRSLDAPDVSMMPARTAARGAPHGRWRRLTLRPRTSRRRGPR